MDVAPSRERHGLLCCPSCFLSKSHIMWVLTWRPRQYWMVCLPSEVRLGSWHHPQKWCNSIYEETLLTRGFSLSEDWKIKNNVPQTRNKRKKRFYLETSEDKGAAINLNLSVVCLGGRNQSALWLSCVSVQSLEQCQKDSDYSRSSP